MTQKRYVPTPIGVEQAIIPTAKLADSVTSKQLVTDQDDDASYFRALERQGIALNQPQLEAVRHAQGPLLILAGAGSGKTSVLVCRTGYLLTVKQVNPRSILLVTFTKKSAEEMKKRVSTLPAVSRQMAQQIQASTFHSFFLTLLRSRGFEQEIISNERYKQWMIKSIMKELGYKDTHQPDTLLALLSSYKTNKINIADLSAKSVEEQEQKAILLQYESWKKQTNRMDFDDILLYAEALIMEQPSLLTALQNRFQYVMVDEFQDTNLIQYDLIRLIAQLHHNIAVVGDDDQTIYSFNGARHDLILGFDQAFPHTKVVTLTTNYRSSTCIVGLGNQVIRHNQKRKQKTLQAAKQGSTRPMFSRPATTDEEADWVVQQIAEEMQRGKRSYRDFAILYRASSNSRAIVEQLTLSGVPFIHYAMSDQLFYDQWMVKPLIDHLRLTLDHRNLEAIEGVIQTLYVNKEKGMHHILAQERTQPKKYPLIQLCSLTGMKEYQAESIKARIKLIKAVAKLKPLAAIQRLRQEFYDSFMEAEDRKQSVQREAVKETLDELESSAKRFDTIQAFISFIGEMMQKAQEMEELIKDPQADAVSLLTIHRSKGMEFPAVFLIGASEGILPHSSSLESEKQGERGKGSKSEGISKTEETATEAVEEERRLAYVAITRAMEDIYISSPSYYRGKKVEVSRFIRQAYTFLGVKEDDKQSENENRAANHDNKLTGK